MAKNEHGKVLVSWKIKEYKQYERKRGWYAIAGLIGLGMLVYAVWTFNFLFAFIVILFGIIIYLQTKGKPAELAVNITEDGIEVGDTFYPYSSIDKFWIIYEPPDIKNLYLHIKRVFRPELSVDLGKANPLKVRKALLDYLEEDLEEEDESGSDYLSRQMKL